MGLYFEAAAVITVLVLLGQVLELRARSQTSQAIRALLGLAPQPRAAYRDGRRGRSAARPSDSGDQLRVSPGRKNAGRRQWSSRARPTSTSR